MFIYLLLAEVIEVGVVEVHEGVLEGSDQHRTILKQFLIQYCTCEMDKKVIFVLYLLLAEAIEVQVVKVDEGVLEDSDQHGTILKQFVVVG